MNEQDGNSRFDLALYSVCEEPSKQEHPPARIGRDDVILQNAPLLIGEQIGRYICAPLNPTMASNARLETLVGAVHNVCHQKPHMIRGSVPHIGMFDILPGNTTQYIRYPGQF